MLVPHGCSDYQRSPRSGGSGLHMGGPRRILECSDGQVADHACYRGILGAPLPETSSGVGAYPGHDWRWKKARRLRRPPPCRLHPLLRRGRPTFGVGGIDCSRRLGSHGFHQLSPGSKAAGSLGSSRSGVDLLATPAGGPLRVQAVVSLVPLEEAHPGNRRVRGLRDSAGSSQPWSGAFLHGDRCVWPPSLEGADGGLRRWDPPHLDIGCGKERAYSIEGPVSVHTRRNPVGQVRCRLPGSPSMVTFGGEVQAGLTLDPPPPDESGEKASDVVKARIHRLEVGVSAPPPPPEGGVSATYLVGSPAAAATRSSRLLPSGTMEAVLAWRPPVTPRRPGCGATRLREGELLSHFRSRGILS